MTRLIYILLTCSVSVSWAIRPENPAESTEAEGICESCEGVSPDLPIEYVGRKKKRPKSKSCPFGVGPMNNVRCDKDLESKIRKVLGDKHVLVIQSYFMKSPPVRPLLSMIKRRLRIPMRDLVFAPLKLARP